MDCENGVKKQSVGYYNNIGGDGGIDMVVMMAMVLEKMKMENVKEKEKWKLM